jgi:hypothetical protein
VNELAVGLGDEHLDGVRRVSGMLSLGGWRWRTGEESSRWANGFWE